MIPITQCELRRVRANIASFGRKGLTLIRRFAPPYSQREKDTPDTPHSSVFASNGMVDSPAVIQRGDK